MIRKKYLQYASRAVNYECKMFIRLTTGLVFMGGDSRQSHGFEKDEKNEKEVGDCQLKTSYLLGGSPGLVVMGVDSRPKVMGSNPGA